MTAGIEEIYLVRGYLAEQFDRLLYKYPNIRFIENPVYNEANNISSLMCVRSLLQNAYVFEGDMLLSNKALVTKYQYSSKWRKMKKLEEHIAAVYNAPGVKEKYWDHVPLEFYF